MLNGCRLLFSSGFFGSGFDAMHAVPSEKYQKPDFPPLVKRTQEREGR